MRDKLWQMCDPFGNIKVMKNHVSSSQIFWNITLGQIMCFVVRSHSRTFSWLFKRTLFSCTVGLHFCYDYSVFIFNCWKCSFFVQLFSYKMVVAVIKRVSPCFFMLWDMILWKNIKSKGCFSTSIFCNHSFF